MVRGLAGFATEDSVQAPPDSIVFAITTTDCMASNHVWWCTLAPGCITTVYAERLYVKGRVAEAGEVEEYVQNLNKMEMLHSLATQARSPSMQVRHFPRKSW